MTQNGEWLQIPADAKRTRLDRYLASRFPDQSRSQIQGWIRAGRVLVNSAGAKTGHVLRPGDIVFIQRLSPAPAMNPQPENIPLTILYQDSDLAVVEKPAGLVCHAGAGIRSGTLVNALLYHLGPLQAFDAMRPGIVHRLDKLSSGLLVVARNLETHRALAQQFKNRQVVKEYLALVYGYPNPSSGTIDLPLGRDRKDRKKISVRSHRRRAAITHYRKQSVHGPFTLLLVRIETGRTHQIRVHLSQSGYPVVGDVLYGGNRSRNLQDPGIRAAVQELQRNFLHAHRLVFIHPGTGERLTFVSPLPPDLECFLAQVA